MAKKIKKAKKKKKKLSAADKAQLRNQRRLYREFRALFSQLGFTHVKVDGTEISVAGRTGELDDLFIYENVLVLVGTQRAMNISSTLTPSVSGKSTPANDITRDRQRANSAATHLEKIRVMFGISQT